MSAAVETLEREGFLAVGEALRSLELSLESVRRGGPAKVEAAIRKNLLGTVASIASDNGRWCSPEKGGRVGVGILRTIDANFTDAIRLSKSPRSTMFAELSLKEGRTGAW